MVKITGEYVGNLRIRMKHPDSGEEIVTDAPKDNGGEGMKFSPTDLVVAALGSCAMTILGLIAKRDGFDLSTMHVELEKEMNSSPPRRIKSINLKIFLPKSLSENERTKLERAVDSCPVLLSLHPQIEVTRSFYYEA